MFRITNPQSDELPDVQRFVDLIHSLGSHALTPARTLFDSGRPVVMARAPGRLDVIGGIADYSGSLVLEMPTREATFAAIQVDEQPRLRILSLGGDEIHRTTFFEMPLAQLINGGEPVSYEAARELFRRNPREHWAAYVAGCFLVLMRECSMRFEKGASILIDSAVPEGKSVSSSAAIEVATMQALLAAFSGPHSALSRNALSPRELAILCQKVENLVVGAPCGVMDQMSSACGRAGQLMALLCQPAELLEPVPIPADVAFWGIDSGVRHSVGGSDYGSVRVGAFMGYRIIADRAGLRVQDGGRGQRVEIDDPRWGGYLANLTPAEFDAQFAAQLPTQLRGSEFLDRYGGTTDVVTRVDRDRMYAVRTPAAHPVYEHARVRQFSDLLRDRSGLPRMESLGRLMYESHASYSACGLGSAATDRIVELVQRMGPAQGLYGAKITGGGSGGTVAVLGHREAEAAVQGVVRAYALETGLEPYVFTGSSPGAAEFGTLRLIPD